MGQDQGLYHAVAEEILRGGVPYRDAWTPSLQGFSTSTPSCSRPIQVDPWRACSIGRAPAALRQPALRHQRFSVLAANRLARLASGDQARIRPNAATVGVRTHRGVANLAILDAEGSTPEKYALARQSPSWSSRIGAGG